MIHKLSGGYLYMQLLVLQVLFITAYILLIFLGDEASSLVSGVSGFRISANDILIILCGIGLQLIGSLIVYSRWHRTEYIVTDENLEIKAGFLISDLLTIPLTDITGSKVHEGIIGHFFHFGTVTVQRRGGAAVTLVGVQSPEQFALTLEKS